MRENQTYIPILTNLNTCLKPLCSEFRSHYVYVLVIDRIKSPIPLHHRKSKIKIHAGKPEASREKGFMCKVITLSPKWEWSYLRNNRESDGLGFSAEALFSQRILKRQTRGRQGVFQHSGNRGERQPSPVLHQCSALFCRLGLAHLALGAVERGPWWLKTKVHSLLDFNPAATSESLIFLTRMPAVGVLEMAVYLVWFNSPNFSIKTGPMSHAGVLLRVDETFTYPMGDAILSGMYRPEKDNVRPRLHPKPLMFQLLATVQNLVVCPAHLIKNRAWVHLESIMLSEMSQAQRKPSITWSHSHVESNEKINWWTE